MNILILNWRDPKNQFSGGAEKLNVEILKPFVDRGDAIIWYAQEVKGLPDREMYQGIEIRRFGNVFTHLLFWPFLYWTNKFGEIDFIIDSIHGTGYLSSLIAPKVKKIILICEIAQNVWDEMYSFPVNVIGKFWEKIMFRFYKNNRFWTISTSTKKDLITFGIDSRHIQILTMGFDAQKLKHMPMKYKAPTALFVGRLAEMKGIKDAIWSIAKMNKESTQKWRLIIVGRGEEGYEKELQKLVSKLGVYQYITFLGYMSERKKFEEMAKAWVMLVPSSREGWGMIVSEANYVGTPVIGYNSPGLSESLMRYSRSNIIVRGKIDFIVKELKKISKPIIVKEKIIPGWDNLHAFVLREYK